MTNKCPITSPARRAWIIFHGKIRCLCTWVCWPWIFLVDKRSMMHRRTPNVERVFLEATRATEPCSNRLFPAALNAASHQIQPVQHPSCRFPQTHFHRPGREAVQRCLREFRQFPSILESRWAFGTWSRRGPSVWRGRIRGKATGIRGRKDVMMMMMRCWQGLWLGQSQIARQEFCFEACNAQEKLPEIPKLHQAAHHLQRLIACPCSNRKTWTLSGFPHWRQRFFCRPGQVI